ncbi:MAG TPA: alpha/beta hydrolase-fold protein [Flavisolibacter sp.]|jgi:predicted esterase|nr:alpha/beta hydrolase-fold protein [Flavisolibacter sp.]
MEKREGYRKAQLQARPLNNTPAGETTRGLQQLDLNQKKECLLYVPAGYCPDTASALILLLHGAGGNAAHGLFYLQQYADKNNLILLAPASQDYSWDIIAADAFGVDVLFIDRVLSYVFERFFINPQRLAIGGFSDGASYALCIGLSNGNLFSHVIAFSPGFYYTYEERGRPSLFVSHGVKDDVLPIDPCSRRIVPRLQHGGYEVLYKEFNGRHEIPAAVSQQAVNWYLEESSHQAIPTLI